MKILTVDDSGVVRKMVCNIVESQGFQAMQAANGQEALDVLRAAKDGVGLVLLDWNMPVMDGLTCLQEIRLDAQLKAIPVMMLTTEAERSQIVRAVEAGANNYLIKPFAPEDLIAKIQACLGKA